MWVTVYVRGWVAKEEILSSASFRSVRLSRRFSFVYFGVKTTQRAVLETGSKGVKKTKDVGHLGVRLWQ